MECVWQPVPLQYNFVSECFVFAFPPNPEMLSLCWEEERKKQVGLYGETSSCAS